MTGPEYFDLARIAKEETVVCGRCGMLLVLRAWVRQKPGDPKEIEIACLPCSEAMEAEDATQERSA